MKANKLTVAINTNKYLPYSETFIKNHIEGLQQFNAVVLVSEKLSDGLSVRCDNELVLNTNLFGKIKDIIYKLGIKLPSISRFFKDNNVRLVHSHFGQNGYASIGITKKNSIPHITTFHGLDISLDHVNSQKHGKLLNKFHKDMGKLADNGDVFIAVSNFIKQKLIKKGFPEHKIITNYIGIDTAYFSNNNADKEKKILCVARNVEYKGLSYLIDAMAIILKYHPDWELVIIGDGILHDSLKKQANAISPQIKLKGRLSSYEVKQELSTASLYCQPSIQLENGHEEALALTIVEAQSMGIPAVVFDSGGMPEAIINNQSGYVVEPQNTQLLAKKLIYLIDNPSIREAFSTAAIEQVKTRHCFNKQIVKLEKIYNEVIGVQKT
ncbi:glycosyltransferase [Shewanella sp. MMG014]|uniref:glycosyltransferase n=1 Tax=Shewanella sp. MMG014 TaxID=2822691 RepID=UPI001B370F65|nr:glycosyltransferase [Shewanella sp. MMG014]MBQ4889122.1 glycosyltransferase [Shewanella sp. MMG014]